MSRAAGQSGSRGRVRQDRPIPREVCRVLIGGADVGLAQIQQGLAWHYKEYQREQSAADRQSYAEAETQARKAQAGLWRDPDPMPPWEWRKQQGRL